MKYIKTNWLDRIVEFPNRYKDQNNNSITLTEDPGDVAQEGTLVDAQHLNNIENGVSDLSLSKNYASLIYDADNQEANNFYLETEISELSVGDVYNFIVPFSSVTNVSDDIIKISIDNKFTYYNLKELEGNVNLKPSNFNYKDRYLSIFFDGTDFRLTNNLPNQITAGITADITKTTTTTGNCPMNLKNAVGTKLTIDNSKIRVGAGVSKVEVSGEVLVKNNATSSVTVQVYIKKMSNARETSINSAINIANANTNLSLAMSPAIIDVVEGDTIYISWWKGNANSLTIREGYMTNLNVRVVE